MTKVTGFVFSTVLCHWCNDQSNGFVLAQFSIIAAMIKITEFLAQCYVIGAMTKVTGFTLAQFYVIGAMTKVTGFVLAQFYVIGSMTKVTGFVLAQFYVIGAMTKVVRTIKHNAKSTRSFDQDQIKHMSSFFGLDNLNKSRSNFKLVWNCVNLLSCGNN